MDLKLFFSPVPESVSAHNNDLESLQHCISIFQHNIPDYKKCQLAIIGVPEYRGTGENIEFSNAADLVRKKFYRLRKSHNTYKVMDCGNLNAGMNLEETHNRLQEVCSFFLQKNILPVIIGGSHDLDIAQYKSYQHQEKLISVLNVDAFIDLQDNDQVAPDKTHVQKILLFEPNYLFHYSHLAYQTYLAGEKVISLLEKMYFEAFRVGIMRENISEMEPVVRNGDMLSFDLTAIKNTDAPGVASPQPFGLSGEEACQICWYAGQNEKLSSAGFYGYHPENDINDNTATVLATMLWYFIEGFYNRKESLKFAGNDYLKYVVSMPSEPENIIFYKSKLSEKWYMEIPVKISGSKTKYNRNHIIPCSYSDYQLAGKGELPERYINTLAKN
ncbi:MAG: formimidoylglutamase [Cyclobacteriaceae bacterium]